MKRTLLCAALAVALSAGQSSADNNIDYTVNLYANIDDVCSFPVTPVASEGADYFSAITTSDVTFEPETDANGVVQNVIGELRFANAVCTQPTNLSLTASQFLHQGTATPGFSTEILYSVQLDWGGDTIVSASTPGTPVSIPNQSVLPTAGDLTLKIVTELGTAPLNQGAYVGTIGFTLSAV